MESGFLAVEFYPGDRVLNIEEYLLKIREIFVKLENSVKVYLNNIHSLEHLKDVKSLEGGGDFQSKDLGKVRASKLWEIDVLFVEWSNKCVEILL